VWKKKLKQWWNDNPAQVIVVGILVVSTATKAIDTASSVRSRHAYAKQINRNPKFR
jgi:hypothetical protein